MRSIGCKTYVSADLHTAGFGELIVVERRWIALTFNGGLVDYSIEFVARHAHCHSCCCFIENLSRYLNKVKYTSYQRHLLQ